MKPITKKAREAARMASPHPEDRFTDAEDDALFESGFRALKQKVSESAKTKRKKVLA